MLLEQVSEGLHRMLLRFVWIWNVGEVRCY